MPVVTPPTAAPITVVGMHGRFPGAVDLRAFWQLLTQGTDAVGEVPAGRWNWRDYDSQLQTGDETSYCQRAGFTPHVDCFDGRFFAILPREVQSMDPQQRLFLQAAWAALEDAGYAPAQLARRRVGVFVGVGHSDYAGLLRRDGVPTDAWRGTGSALTAIANRVSFCLDLQGPSESIDTACSGSLVAVHRACQALQAGECDLAIVGGVNLLLSPELFVAFSKAGMLSHAGHCQTFAASADGYVRGEGIAALVLAPQAAARENGDFIYGEICASAQNHGGRAHSFTAPNPKAQTDVIERAWQRAGYSPRQASLIETHGTGTPLGDPIEINALKKALPVAGTGAPIALGALKTQIGHLEAAAGIASLIKGLLCLQHRQVVGNLHHSALNPQISLADSPFYLPDATAPLVVDAHAPLLAGVSAFGFGGVNAHVVLKAAEPAVDSPAADDNRPYLLLLSAKDKDGLRARARQLLAAFGEPLPDASAALRQALVERLRDLLGLMPDNGTATPLATLKVDAGYFVGCLEQALEAQQLDTPIDAWRGAISLEEVVERLVSEATLHVVEEPRLDSFNALPAELPASASLAAIARSLLEGRDAMAWRLAFVVQSRAQLFDALRDYLDASPAPSNTLWRSDAGLPATPAPDVTDGRANRALLEQWAAHWAAGKAPSPPWSTLYADEPRPNKFPLPAYPWRLERVWYTPAQATPAPAPRLAPTAAQAWLDCWEPGAALPGSVMALAGLIGHASRLTPHSTLHWRDLRFGPPVPLPSTEALQYTRARDHWQVSLDTQVLLQVETPTAIALAPPWPARPAEVELGAPTFYAAQAKQGLAYSVGGQVIQALRSTANGLQATLHEPCHGVDDFIFWAGLLSNLSAALGFLDPATEPGLPYRIRHLTLDPLALHEARQLSVERQGAAFDIALCTADGRCALRLDGLQLRGVTATLTRVSA
ncbi:hypothetical protein NPS46_08035 [Pseudomonas putida]|uniref:beta-ketoacyl synthase N-terminal-like domain-containing protein n=1 Tax=Pseudomonas putida TaxID=303 RepID=UPI0023646A24|nr:beta-ketoacyl synthase N-terminal-like domain-containing protein [Pseudomonas putida]MDD2052490.1 hypothetical protein [Pseudomonas putida]